VLTIKELQEVMLEQLDELEIFDLLEITAEDLVYAFEDKIAKYSKKIELELADAQEDLW
jgi:hypothetical protein